MINLRIITLILSTFIICVNLYAQYDAGTVIYNQTSSTNLTSIQKNYIVEDFDGDFNADVIMVKSDAGNETNQLLWYKGDGNGNFAQQAILLTFEYARWGGDHRGNEIFYTDMNEDGINDIVFQNSDTGFEVLLNDGNGNISAQINNVTATGNLVGADLKEIADIDGDGDMDGIFWAKTDSVFSWIYNHHFGYCQIGYNNGNGYFSNYNYLDNDIQEIFILIETGDIDGDGDLDVVCSGNKEYKANGGEGPVSFENPFVRLYKNLGSGAFAAKHEISFPVVNNDEPGFTHIKIEDINDDGNDELLIEYAIRGACFSHFTNCAYLYQFHVLDYNVQNSAFTNLATYNSWLHGYTMKLDFYDYYDLYDEAFLIQFDNQNTDNNLDILSVNVPQGKLQWYLGDGNGSFNNTQVVNSNSQYSSIRPALRVADIDNDTDLDIFVLLNDGTSSNLTVFKNLTLTPSCSSVLDLGNNALTNGIYQAGTTVISAGDVVNGNNNVVLKAGNNVRLESGFKAPTNSTVKVRISSCN